MSLSVAARPLARSAAFRTLPGRMLNAQVRLESTAAQKATDSAKDAASKAASGLSRVTSTAGPAIAKAASGVTGALGRVGGRTGRLVGFVERQVPWVIYYSRVGLEVSKLVFQGQKMSPPSLATFQSYFQTAWKAVQSPSTLLGSSSAFIQQARGLSRAQLATGGVILAELLGFFTVGEMIGRFKLIGYHGESGAHH